ncbi:MAG: hypothetical protein JEZ03_16035 [Bacteroidales bacterium]|nr:hypothetical protein [Bacteroidales bacterium]
MRIISKFDKPTIIMIALGAIGGFAYWHFVGCASGTCPIQSYWYTSTAYGALIGYFVGGLFGDYSKKNSNKKDQNGIV